MTTPLNAFRQGIFDIIVERGSEMKTRCMDPSGNCAYRDGKGGACWAGLVMSDAEALNKDGVPHIGSVYSLQRDGVLPERYRDHVDLLADFQRIHDEYQNWDNVVHPVTRREMFGHGAPRKDRLADQLRDLAARWGLDAKSVDDFYPA